MIPTLLALALALADPLGFPPTLHPAQAASGQTHPGEVLVPEDVRSLRHRWACIVGLALGASIATNVDTWH